MKQAVEVVALVSDAIKTSSHKMQSDSTMDQCVFTETFLSLQKYSSIVESKVVYFSRELAFT